MTEEQIKCQYCDKPQEEGKDIKKHERFCSKNPNNARSKKSKSPDPEGAISQATIISQDPSVPPQSSPSVDNHKPLIISEVQRSCIDAEEDDVAWFMDDKGNRKYKVPMFIGLLDGIPHNLVTTIDGTLIPAVLLPGFIGMHSKYHDFSDQDKPADEPEQDDCLPEHTMTSIEPIKRDLSNELSDQVIIPQEDAPEPKKKSFLAGIFGKKEKKEEKLLSSDTKEMLKKIALGGEP